MKKLRYITIPILIALIFAGCQKDIGFPDETTNTEITNTDTSAEEMTFPTDKVLHWAVPDMYNISTENLVSLNQALVDKGYDFSIDFVPLTFENYAAELQSAENIDIASAGLDTEEFSSVEFIRSGYFRSLDNLLTDKSELFDRYSVKQWKTVSVDNKIYTVPNTCAKDRGVSFVFNNEYFSKEEIENFDMKFSSLRDMLGDPTQKDGFSDFVYLIDEFMFSLLDDSLCVKGFAFSESSGSVDTIFSDESSVEFFRTLNEFYKKGYINYNLSLYMNGIESCKKLLDSGSFKVYVTSGGISEIEEIDNIRDSVTVKTTQPVIHSRVSGGMGIAADSKYADEAFTLLTLVYTDPDILKYLVLDNSEDTESARYINEMIIGSDHFSGGTEGMKEFYDNDVKESLFLGFNANFSKSKDKAAEVYKICYENLDIWKSENFEDELDRVKKLLAEAGAEELASEINSQFESYKKAE